MPPTICCIVVLDLICAEDDGLKIACPRTSLRGAPQVPPGARVRLRLGAARAINDVYIDLLVCHLKAAASVEIEAEDPSVAVELHTLLSEAMTTTRLDVA